MILEKNFERELADCYGYAAAWYYHLNREGQAQDRLLPLIVQIQEEIGRVVDEWGKKTIELEAKVLELRTLLIVREAAETKEEKQ